MLAPTKISSGYINNLSAGISIARIDIAPAGGRYIFIPCIINATSIIDSVANKNSGKPNAIQANLQAQPIKADIVIKAQARLSFFRAGQFSLENSVKATNKGGATIKFKLYFIAIITNGITSRVLKNRL